MPSTCDYIYPNHTIDYGLNTLELLVTPTKSISMKHRANGIVIKNVLDKCICIFAVSRPQAAGHANVVPKKGAVIVLNTLDYLKR